MARSFPVQQLYLISSIVAEHPSGISISALSNELSQRLPQTINRRTLQRRLHDLIQDRLIVTEGESIALVYKPGPASPVVHVPGISNTALGGEEDIVTEVNLPLSAEGTALRNAVQRPLRQRPPANYHRDFLAHYEPQVTFYLSEALRRELHEMGSTRYARRRAGTFARSIFDSLVVDFSWASCRLEGGSYNQSQVNRLLRDSEGLADKDARETQLLLNHKAAIEILVEDAAHMAFDSFTFQNLNAVLSQDLTSEPNGLGRLRRAPLELADTAFRPLAMPSAIEDGFKLMLSKASSISDPFEQAFFILVQLPYLQPFNHVTDPLARMGANLALFKRNLCPITFMDVPPPMYRAGTLAVLELNRMELLRDVFVWAYERSCQQYVAQSPRLAAPDPLRMQYRKALAKSVQDIVKNLRVPTPEVLYEMAVRHAPADQDAFTTILKEALERLHEGSIARYRLRRADYFAWQRLLEVRSRSRPC